MKKISKVATAGVLLFALANPLGAFAENNVENISATSNNKETQDITIQAKEVNGEIVFEVTAAKDTYNTVVYATINGQKFTYNLGNLKKGQISKVVQPDVSVNKKYTGSIAKEDEASGNKKNATITKESKTEKSLPNTSVVRELVEKTVLYSSELNGNVIEAKIVYKAYDLVEKNSNTIEEKKSTTENKVKDGAIVKPEVLEIPEYKENLGGAIVEPAVQPELPKVEEPAAGTTPKVEEPAAGTTPKAEEPAGTTPKAEEPAAGTTTKAEEPAAGTTPKAEEPAGTTPKAEEPAAGTTPKAEEPAAGTTPKAEEPAAGTTPKAEEPAGTTPKAEEPAGTTPKAEKPVAGTTPKAEEPAAGTTPKAEEPAAGTTPKAEPAAGTTPKAEEPAAGTTPKAEEPAAGTTPKAEEPAAGTTPKAEKPAAGTTPKAEEPAAGTTPKAEEPAAGTTPKAEEPAAGTTPKAEEPAAGTTPKAEEPAVGTTPKAEEPAVGTTPKAEEPAAGTTPKAEESAAATTPKVEEPAAGTTPKAEEPAAGTTPKAEESAASAPKEDTPSEEVAPKDEKLEEAKKDGKNIIEKIAASKLSEIEKVKDEAEKAKLEAKLNELKEAGLKAINNAKDHDAAVTVADEYQTKIDGINVPGEELPAPNFDKDNLTNGRNEGTTIANGSTVIGHGSGEATATTPTQPATETTSDSTTTAKPQPVATSETATTGTSGFRSAPEVQVRTKKVVKRDLSNKTKQINIYYNLTALKDIAGALGEVGENNMLTLSGNATKEEIKKAIEEHTKSQIEKLNNQGFKVTSTTDLDQIVEGSDSYDYVVEFTKEAKTQSAGNTGFRKAPATQRRAKRSTEAQENVNVNIYFNLKTLPGIAGALDVDGDNTIKLPKNATVEQVKAAIQTKIAKVKKRGYKVNDAYFGARTEQGYDFVVEFTK